MHFCARLVLAGSLILAAAAAPHIATSIERCAPEHTPTADITDRFTLLLDADTMRVWTRLVVSVLVTNRSLPGALAAGADHVVELTAVGASAPYYTDTSTRDTPDGRLTVLHLVQPTPDATANATALSLAVVYVHPDTGDPRCYGVGGAGLMTRVEVAALYAPRIRFVRAETSALCSHVQPAECVVPPPALATEHPVQWAIDYAELTVLLVIAVVVGLVGAAACGYRTPRMNLETFYFVSSNIGMIARSPSRAGVNTAGSAYTVAGAVSAAGGVDE